ncbi:Histidine kinase/HSP90-like ATPase superfamily [Arabidopsis thaliana x Arabidopsis arenosa]|uniref:Histidine kinase/HSP90-like ATPase superfamily n=1 Tax=Arabidopsis thaliana x Arabidopsis arenosa TaxID=1240361 RepID=A0A8T1Y4I5_9BRAS|nr:Histidine kinase/HSP90-like ATPase superfamily [Arabidopsis thaliana x Arabidopsis arenosa]
MENIHVKREIPPPSTSPAGFPGRESVTVVDLCSSDDDSDIGEIAADRRYNSGNNFVGLKRARDTFGGSSEVDRNNVKKVTTLDELAVVLPEGFGQSNPPEVLTHAIPANPCNVFRPMPPPPQPPYAGTSGRIGGCKQFWKAGDYEGAPGANWDLSSGGFDHVRVHPKFLHSNATSHKWALGAFAELLDNALDEVASGATYVKVDMLENNKAGNRMLLIEDNGGGMDPEKMRQCMSLGYSAKSKLANTIGQYGNGFKTSTMRLGADVIVFSRCPGKDGKSSTQSIGLLSYTFLRSTGKEDIVVPMLDYERREPEWSKIIRSSLSDWEKNVETIIQWSPFSSEEDLLHQFDLMKDRGTRIIIYNLWEDDQGMLELDFDADPYDIQLRGVNREEKNIKMASQFPNSRHFLTYKHSLRSYVSILYLRIPPGFRIILRGKDVEHHSVVNDMMQTEQITYRPQSESYGVVTNMSAIVIIGFVKDAKHHVDVQGFNVYHKNRLIKPFWRIWNATGSDGRGVIGVLEANFVEPAHDKQGFERTTVLSRLESRLVQMQKTYWSTNCHKIGYAPRRHQKSAYGYDNRDSSPENDRDGPAPSSIKTPTPASDKFYSSSYPNHNGDNGVSGKDSAQLQEELRREKERRKALEVEVQLARQKIEEMKKEQENLIEIFSEERDRRDGEEETLRNKLEEASNTIDDLLNKIKKLEGTKVPNWRH